LGNLLSCLEPAESIESLGERAAVLRGFARQEAAALVAAVAGITASAPLRNMITPGGFRMSVAMTNCGRAGWVTDRKGYRYELVDPTTGCLWPPMPPSFRRLAAAAAEVAGFAGFVSVSLGLPAIFLFGGNSRSDRPRRIGLESGDVVVWGGPDRLVYHGVAPLAEGDDPLTGRCRINLTFRKAL